MSRTRHRTDHRCSAPRRGARLPRPPAPVPLEADPPTDTPTGERPPLPERIGKYAVLERIGAGATSEVFLCRDEFHGGEVALKRLRLLDASVDDQAAFHRHFYLTEAALVGRLRHPNVVEILDAVNDPDGPYVVMEYVKGTTLRPYCEPDKLLPLDLIVEIGFKCAMALDYVARQGIIHRDIKPANLLATLRRGQINNVKISDFGSAWDTSSETTQVFRVGSLAYMSPEQIDGGRVTAQADMYSLGAVLYQLIAGRPPFEAVNQGGLIHQIVHREPLSLRMLREGVTEALDAVVQHALAKKPGDRYAHWGEFAQALSSLVTAHAVPLGARQQVLDSERFTLLRSLEFFRDFDDVSVWEVVHRGDWQRFAAGHELYRVGEEGRSFHVIARGGIRVEREGREVARLGAGTTVGEMAYLAPSEALRKHSASVVVTENATTVSFTPESIERLSPDTRHQFDLAFIGVLVRRLHAAHEALAHPRRIL